MNRHHYRFQSSPNNGAAEPCPCCEAEATSSARRKLLGKLTGVLIGVPVLASPLGRGALAASDLLAPGNIGTSAGANGGAWNPGAAGESGTAKAMSSTDGRYMAEVTVGNIDLLCSSADRIVKEIASLEKDKTRRQQELNILIDERDSKLAEYRQGLFCSGCGKTKSEILALGETFPHPGQRIVRPTREQIEDKEEELQRPIDAIERAIARLLKELQALLAQRNEALNQIAYGVDFWRTGFSYELSVLTIQREASQKRFDTKRTELTSIIKELDSNLRLPHANQKPEEKARMDKLKQQIEHWRKSLDLLKREHDQQVKGYDQKVAQHRQDAVREAELITTFVSRGDLHRVLTVIPSSDALSPYASPNTLGIKFRRGDYNPKNSDNELPAVADFISRFRQLSYASGIGAPAGSSAGLPNQLLAPMPSSGVAGAKATGSGIPDHLLKLP